MAFSVGSVGPSLRAPFFYGAAVQTGLPHARAAGLHSRFTQHSSRHEKGGLGPDPPGGRKALGSVGNLRYLGSMP